MASTPSLPRSSAASAQQAPTADTRTPSEPTGIPIRTILLGVAGVTLISLGGAGAGAVLKTDPLLTDLSLSWVRYGHGHDLATALLYAGLGLVIWAWVRLGRMVHHRLVGTAAVLIAIVAWTLPLLLSPPLFSKDVYSYLAQGQLALHGFDPYRVGPAALPSPLSDNVSWVWQNTPAPYGPLFILIAKTVVWATGASVIGGVVLMRLVLAAGLALMCWSLPGLTRHLGGRPAVALWLAGANPLMLVHLIGGGHNDILMVGLMAAGVLLVLDRRHVLGIVLVALAVAVKATAAVALPFLVLVWAARLDGSQRARLAKAIGGGVAVFVAVFAVCSLVAGVDLGWIPALSSSSTIVNWLSLPSAVGDFVYTLVSLVVKVEPGVFMTVARGAGSLLLLYIAWRQWRAAEDGGPNAIRHAALTMLAVALLSPATLPWYFSWPLVLGAGLAWTATSLTAVVFFSSVLLLVTFPNGDTALYSWGYLALTAAVSALAAVSLTRPDPLELSSRYGPRP
ncbi:polyprenol phosphomannose-dependent alpha 1,6 mannosyltransferase MptB [Umezawaea tangerina]|uniref:Alpha-1,6-mannosyltransferase n=1 Tax=Umezawaea tangerina TaxID=84725 RepID=A0A2T0SKU2_9PSEU|nr:polyprenol phosphomannose-dependent alpha 1,6 mannosyltransferase MptB [Umezawaea tangerina]PRY34003.1 alpha-1,6-mannosyltransferase [Umezawaea tangerina]